MHSINTIFKKLRTERTISQADLVKNISNRSTLSSFEQKGSKISFDLLRRYLHRMNITLEEFEDLIHDEVQLEKKALSKKMLSLYYNNDFENLQTYCLLCEEKHNKNKDFFYYHLYAQYIFILDTKEIISLSDSKKKDIQVHIYDYLNKIENWGKFEFSLFINLMYLFDDDYILLILKNML
ncbi:Rgg/GadR/MutR family transcriptional regulator [Enterococcus rotai]|uniref:Rgg/GadR/MutR family transcriptional regulator n=1 Tax=Enterococcus rotai TaxID=118060 RepID=UPI0032B5540D